MPARYIERRSDRSGPEPAGFAAYMRWLGFAEFTDEKVEAIHRELDAREGLTPGRPQSPVHEEWL